MLIVLFLLLTITPVVELYVLLTVHRSISDALGPGRGLLITIGTVILTGVLGTILARRQGMAAIRALTQTIGRGEFPGRELMDAALVLVGAALLVTPGYVTDVVGLSLLVPPTRALYRRALLAWVRHKVARGQASFVVGGRRIDPDQFRDPRNAVIDVTPEDDPTRR